MLVAFGPETSEFTLLTIAPFAAITQKIGISRQISLAQGRCYGNQLNMGDVRKRRVEGPLLFASAFDN